MDPLNNLIFFLIAVAILVSFHEFGHFIVARWMGVRVLRFSVGFGRTLWRWQKNENSTEYVIGLIPLGGYVRMLDEREGEVSVAARDQAFNRKSLFRRSLIVLAGPLANLLLAIGLYWGVGIIGSEDLDPVVGRVQAESIGLDSGFEIGDRILKIDDRSVYGWSEQRLYLLDRAANQEVVVFDVEKIDARKEKILIDFSSAPRQTFAPAVLRDLIGIGPLLPVYEAKVGGVVPDGPADNAGIKKGDRILAIDNESVLDWGDFVRVISGSPGQSLSLAIQRQGERVLINVVPESMQDEGRSIGRIGVFAPPPPPLDEFMVTVRYGLLESIFRAIDTTWLMSAVTVQLFGKMLTGGASREHLSGPISIARYAGQSADLGIAQFLAFLAVLSVSLGILNLLPIPVLDGGHLVYFLIEGVTRRPVPEVVMYWGQQIGIGIIVLLMGLAFYNDLISLFR